LKILILKNKQMKKLMLLVAVATFAIGTAAYAGGNDKNAEKKACCKSGGAKACGKAESKSCHGKEEKAMDKSSNGDAKSEKSASKSETAK
jgi:hypothetical protein